MRHKLSHCSAKSLTFVALLICVIVITPMVAEASNGEKNNGILSDSEAGPQIVPPGLPYGTRVKAVVDYPSGSDCIRVGDKGTIYCYDPNDPNLPYLVNWDRPCGYEQCQICGICAPHGWWVGSDEIDRICPTARILSTPSDLTYEVEKNLAISRSFRDKVLSKSATGREFIGLYYLHSLEAGQIMTENPVLFLRTASLFMKAFPAIKIAVSNNGTLYLHKDVLYEVNQLLDEYEALASPELAVSIEKLRAFLWDNSREIKSDWVSIDLNE